MASKSKTVENEAIATRPQNTAVATYDPNLAAGDVQGTENISSDDVKIPFLAIAQKTSKALDATEGRYIEGLKLGDMYNSETREVYGVGPIRFLPIKLGKRAHLKNPNGTMAARVEWDDPRVTWDGAREAGREKPEGIRIYDWAVLLLPSLETVMLSFYSTSFSAGQSLNTLIDRYKKLAIMAKKGFRPYQLAIELSTYVEQNDAGKFGKFKVEISGGPTKDQFEFADAWFNVIKDKVVVATDDDIVDEPGSNDGPAVVTGEPVAAGKTPF